jgi:hypothetical protein
MGVERGRNRVRKAGEVSGIEVSGHSYRWPWRDWVVGTSTLLRGSLGWNEHRQSPLAVEVGDLERQGHVA